MAFTFKKLSWNNSRRGRNVQMELKSTVISFLASVARPALIVQTQCTQIKHKVGQTAEVLDGAVHITNIHLPIFTLLATFNSHAHHYSTHVISFEPLSK